MAFGSWSAGETQNAARVAKDKRACKFNNNRSLTSSALGYDSAAQRARTIPIGIIIYRLQTALHVYWRHPRISCCSMESLLSLAWDGALREQCPFPANMNLHSSLSQEVAASGPWPLPLQVDG